MSSRSGLYVVHGVSRLGENSVVKDRHGRSCALWNGGRRSVEVGRI